MVTIRRALLSQAMVSAGGAALASVASAWVVALIA